jgi:hypothetical protein
MPIARLVGTAGLSATASWVVCSLAVAGLLIKTFANGTEAFDIGFADETIYMGSGLRGPDFSNHERSGLYGLYYRVLSRFIDDPVVLYLWGGILLLNLFVLAVFVSIGIIARSPLVGLFAAAFFPFSNQLTVWPRISYAAIVVLCLGMVAATSVRPLPAKASILLLTSFLVAFIRPEFVLSFYIFIAVTAVALLWAAVSCARTRQLHDLVRPAMAPGWIALLLLAVLLASWSFPVLKSGQRAFVAFGQHFAARYVHTNKLTINPWRHYRDIVEPLFPGAESVSDAIRIAPGVAARFMLRNAVDLATQIGKSFGRIFTRRPPGGPIVYVVGWTLIAAGLLGALMRARGRTFLSPTTPDYWSTVAASLALMLPPFISTIVIYPRHHYIVILLYLLLVCCAARIARIQAPRVPRLAVAAAIAGLLVGAPTLPKIDRGNLRDIEAVRAIPGIEVLFEEDLGWCVYYRPPCKSVFVNERERAPGAFQTLINTRNVNAVMISPALRTVMWISNDPFFEELEANPDRFGFEKIVLPTQRVLLLKRSHPRAP